MSDIRIDMPEGRFSFRAGGICLYRGGILLCADETGDYAIPGGHVAYGEDSRTALAREFREKAGIEVLVGELKWIGELFFTMKEVPYHQICFYYRVYPKGPLPEVFPDRQDGASHLMFRWVPLSQVGEIGLVPACCVPLLARDSRELEHFVYREEPQRP